MVHIHNRPKPEILPHECLNSRSLFGKCNVHLNSALTVSDVVNLLLDYVIDISEGCRKVEVSHILEGKLPEFCVLIGIESDMLSGVFVASAVAQPDIIALVG